MDIPNIIAHGIGSRTALPLPLWQLAWAAIAALGVSFLGLSVLWKRPVLASAANGRSVGGGKLIPVFSAIARTASTVLFVVCIMSGLFGEDQALQNITPVTIYVMVWVAVPFLSAFVGNIWGIISPFETIGLLVRKVRPNDDAEAVSHHWFAVATIFAFLFLELAHPSGSSPRVLAYAMIIYTLITIVGLATFGASWLRNAEGFAVLFRLIGAMSPLFRTDSGSLGLRMPLSGLSQVDVRPATVVLILLALGGTSFDGFSESEDFIDLVGQQTGWSGVSPTVVGLLITVAIAYGLYWLGSKFTSNVTGLSVGEAMNVFAPSLVPIVWGYLLAHYALLLIDETQRFWYLLSNPLGTVDDAGNPAMNIFGAAGGTIDFGLVDLGVVAWIQTIGIVIGHMAGVMVAHDIGISRFGRLEAIRSQYAMLFVMMIYSVGGLALLFNG